MRIRHVQPPWGHWHEIYTALSLPYPNIPSKTTINMTALELQILAWLTRTNAHVEHQPESNRVRITWSMPVSMTIVYGPWAPTLLEAALAAKETYETVVFPNGIPEP